MSRRTPEAVRFWAKVNGGDFTECWVWTGALSDNGYGSFALAGGKITGAHRWSYQYLIHDIPAGLQLDHLCRNRACVNPFHLDPVTPSVNVLRGTAPAVSRERMLSRTHCVQGHPLSGDNLYIQPNGWRSCRKCGVVASLKYQQRIKARWVALDQAVKAS